MAGLIPERVLEEIVYRNDIVEVIGAHVTLKHAGASHKGLCPFHKEKTPSFNVNPQRQSFHCFGCGAHGDVIKFVMLHQNLDFLAAVRALAERAGIALELGPDDGVAGLRKTLLALHSDLASSYHMTLLRSPGAEAARRYLKERDLTADTLDAFLIGYAPDAWETAVQWAPSKGYTLDHLVEAGLAVRRSKEQGEGAYDRFRNRIMFPIRDAQGRVVGFSGRVLEASAKEAKYVNSPETPIFQKGRILYAMDKARTHIAKAREAIVCEGQIDVIRCHQAGFCGAVASQGTAFTADHVAAIKRLADSVVLAFDGDEAGQTAAVKTARLFLEVGLAVRVAVLPAGEDPDSLIRRDGADAFSRKLAAAVSAVTFQAGVLASRRQGNSEADLLRAAREVLETVACTPNSVQRTRLLDDAAEALHVPRTVLEEELRRGARMRTATRAAPRATVATAGGGADARRGEVGDTRAGDEETAPPVEELMLCEHLVHAADDTEIRGLVAKYLPLDLIGHATCRAAVQLVLAAGDTGVAPEQLAAEAEGGAPAAAELIRALCNTPSKVTGREFVRREAVQDLILRLWRKRVRQERERTDPYLPEARQLTNELSALGSWRDGHGVIEIRLLPP